MSDKIGNQPNDIAGKNGFKRGKPKKSENLIKYWKIFAKMGSKQGDEDGYYYANQFNYRSPTAINIAIT